MVANGRDGLVDLIKQLPPSLKYEQGIIIAEGDLVMIQARYSGVGDKAMIAIDIIRVEEGKIAEHWDVVQEEVPASASKNGNAMFEPK